MLSVIEKSTVSRYHLPMFIIIMSTINLDAHYHRIQVAPVLTLELLNGCADNNFTSTSNYGTGTGHYEQWTLCEEHLTTSSQDNRAHLKDHYFLNSYFSLGGDNVLRPSSGVFSKILSIPKRTTLQVMAIIEALPSNVLNHILLNRLLPGLNVLIPLPLYSIILFWRPPHPPAQHFHRFHWLLVGVCRLLACTFIHLINYTPIPYSERYI